MTFRALSLSASVFTAICALQPAYADNGGELRIISSRPDAVSGGTALARLKVPARAKWSVQLNGRDITASFRTTARPGELLAPLQGLAIGKSELELRVGGKPRAKIDILNHPLSGPMFSGPHQHPFICQTEANGLGPALDANCTADPIVGYYYKSSSPSTSSPASSAAAPAFKPAGYAPGFNPYDSSGTRPDDITQLVLPDGHTMDYIVRREIGVINRAVYEIQFLHVPGQPLPTPWTRPTPGWNGRLVYTFGPGCGAAYRQGILPAFGRADHERLLALGYALVTASLNALGNECNDKVSAETASMVKEHFIEQFGKPAHTIGTGASGGAVAVYLIAQNYPGILDGIIAYLSAPDIPTTVIPVFSDCALLDHAFKTSRHSWSEVQKTAVSGFATWQTCPTEALWLDPTSCDPVVAKELIYDRSANPKGTRCSFYDNAVSVFGRDPQTGFARRTLDNVGIQYGLVAFNAGKIDAEQFIDLNQNMGGYDQDGRRVSARTAADPQALRMAYEHGVVVAGRSLSDVPIIDWNRYTDQLGDFHSRDRSFITRARLVSANGHADNQVVLVTPPPTSQLVRRTMPGVGLHVLVPQMDSWLNRISADQASGSLTEKIVRNKPAELADGCIAVDGERIAEPATYKGPGRCNQLYPAHGNPRVAAGEPISGDRMKCTLKPVNPADYSRPLTADQIRRLRAVFPSGVCDYSKPGVGQGPSPAIWHKFTP